MPTPKLKNERVKVGDLISDYRAGRLVIPEFQRDYVWRKNKAPLLLDSLYRSFPVSTLLLWQSSEYAQPRRASPRPAGGRSMSWLIDGQQRVMTLSRAMNGDESIEVVFNPESEDFSLVNAVELLHADESYVTVVPAGSVLPIENEVGRWPLDVYCVDPRDGYAKFHFVRPKWPSRFQSIDERLPYANLLINVDADASPLSERLNMEIKIDHDLVAEITARSSLVGDSDSVEVHDLEFGIEVGRAQELPDE